MSTRIIAATQALLTAHHISSGRIRSAEVYKQERGEAVYGSKPFPMCPMGIGHIGNEPPHAPSFPDFPTPGKSGNRPLIAVPMMFQSPEPIHREIAPLAPHRQHDDRRRA